MSSATASGCPVCFDCRATGCGNFGTCTTTGCSCPLGFGGVDCNTPVCGSTNTPNSKRPARSGKKCTCDTGFDGINCNVCTTDSACTISNSAGLTPVCNRDVKVWKAGTSYCKIDAALLTSVYPKESVISFTRNTTSKVTLGNLWYDGDEQFSCVTDTCAQVIRDGQYQWTCDNVVCMCTGKSAFCGGPGSVVDLSSSIESADGDFSLNCGANSSNCIAKFSFLKDLFPDGLDLNGCIFGECAFPSDNPDIVEITSARGLNSGEKAGLGVAGFVAFLAIAALIWSAVYQHHARRKPLPQPPKGVNIEFKDIEYSIQNGKLILSNISGVASAGKVFAIMGPSGAGKSTFIDIISGKSKRGFIGGEIMIDGEPAELSTLRSLVGYVDQEDLLMSTMTVRETLMFSASLRLPESVSRADRVRVVNEVMESLGLAHVADSRVGGFGRRGISGGEKRRVSIGVELVTSPSVLVLDEPTSGLDSFNAYSVIKTLTRLAHENGKTVIFTIHQPRSDVYNLFDEVLLLSGGTALYCGPGSGASSFFRAKGRACPDGYNIADHLLDLASLTENSEFLSRSCLSIAARRRKPLPVRLLEAVKTDASAKKQQLLRVGPTQGETTHSSPLFASTGDSEDTAQIRPSIVNVRGRSQVDLPPRIGSHETITDDEVQTHVAVGISAPEGKPAKVEGNKLGYKVGFLTQLTVLMGRSMKNLYRTPSLLLGHMLLAVTLGCLIGGLYYRSGNSLSGVQNRLGSLMFILALIGFSGLSGIGAFAAERQLFLRERSNRFYSAFPFYISKLLFDIIPLRLAPALVLGSISFYLIGFTNTGDRYAKFLAILLIFAAEIGLLCLFFAIIISDIGSATLYGSIVILFKMLFGGLLINQDQIIGPLSWLQYLSFFRFAYEALVVNDLSDIQIVDKISGSGVNIPASTVLLKFGFDIDAYWRNLLISAGVTVLLLVCNGIWIQFVLRERR
ncbi:hypothetical protein DFJ73DRAFT_79391 [Zopfochytrium polystomum]|nr:hypothetical protein DFJ73DRAFT_79391 [Zopfochytrium polystomum]